MSIEHTLQRVRDFRASQGLSIYALAKRAGMRVGTLLRMDDLDWSPSANTIRRIEAIMPQGSDDDDGAQNG